MIIMGPDRAGRVVVYAGNALAWEGIGDPPAAVVSARHEVERLSCEDEEIRFGHVNAHTHLYSGLVPYGVPKPEPWPSDFTLILKRLWWRLDRALDERTLRSSARLAIAESLLAGTTTLIDHHESPRYIEGSLTVLAEECDRFGIRAVLCYGASERNHGRAEAIEGLDECERLIRRLRSRADKRDQRDQRIVGLVGLHAGFTVSDATLRDAVAMANDLGVGLHLHAAESEVDVIDAKRRGYRGVMQRLDANLALGPKTILAHGIHLEADEVVLADRRGVWFVQNPRSNRGNGVGYPQRLGLTSRVALGTDGFPSRMEAEVSLAAEAGAHLGEAQDLAESRLAAGLALAECHLGPGLRGDRVAMGRDGARHVVIDGRVVVRDYELVGHDLEKLREEATSAAGALAARMRHLE